jgi:hypothetical protein
MLTTTFVVVVIVTTIGVHPMNDGLSTIMLTFKVVDGLFPISVSATSNFMDRKKIINNFSHVVTSIDQKNAFV